MRVKKLLFFAILFQLIFLTGCWNSREINTLAIAVCTGIDKVEEGYLVTQQIINPKAIASKKPTSEAPVVLYSETGRDIFEIMRKLTAKCPRKIYVSHLRMVVFGEDVAKDGIEDVLDFFARDHEFRTDFYFVIAKGTTANKVLSILTPLEAIPGIDMSDSLKVSEKSWAPTKTVRITELINSLLADGKNAVLSGIEILEGEPDSNSTDALKLSEGMKKLHFVDIGAFKKDKLVGWLSEDDSKGFNYIINNVKNTVGYLYYNDKTKITVEIISSKTKLKASLKNGKPVINVDIKLKAKVGAVSGQFDVSKEENKQILIKLLEDRVKERCVKTINIAQKDFKSDIFGFGEVVHRDLPKTWAKIKSNWDKEFQTIPANISVSAKVTQLGQVTKPFFIKEKD